MVSAVVLIVGADPAARRRLRLMLEARPWRVREADPGDALQAIASDPPDAVLLELPLSGGGGIVCLEEMALGEPRSPVVVLSPGGDSALAVACLAKGAYDCLSGPLGTETLSAAIERALEKVSLEREIRRLRAELSRGEGAPLGVTPAMVALERLIGRMAPSEVTVLVSGESGTGKELVARDLHRRSPRKDAPFVALNCAALPGDLVESELFGHEKGAFTGAIETRKGKFEAADGGTLFLDEVGEMALGTQSKLLRILQERTFERVGSNRTLIANVRVVAATNKDLLAEVAAGRFRQDLYYRLNVAHLRVPPLRERAADIAPLAHRFLAAAAAGLGREITGITPEAMAILESVRWPGNVRELKNAIEYAAVMSDGGPITAAMLPVSLRASAARVLGEPESGDISNRDLELPFAAARERAIEAFERRYIEVRLRRVQGDLGEAARAMGLTRASLEAKLEALVVDPAQFRRDPGNGSQSR